MPRRKISNIEELAADYAACKSLTKLQTKYGFERHALSRALVKYGVKIVQNNQQYSYNKHLFDTIDTEEKAYWLGFWYADGNISIKRKSMEITLKADDEEHLKKFRDLICPELPICTRRVELHGRVYEAVRLSFSCEAIHAALIKQGCIAKKSLALTYPTETQVPKQLQHHFIRGYFDGDGYVGLSHTPKGTMQLHFSVEGTKHMLDGIQEIFNEAISKYSIVSVKKRKKQQSHVFQKGGNASVIRIHDYLYKDATIYLKRKYDIFQTFITNNCRSIK